MKKSLVILLALFLVIGLGTASAQIWVNKAPDNYRIMLTNDPWAPGFSIELTPAWLFNGNKITAGEVYELDMTFKANRDIPAPRNDNENVLYFMMADASEAVSWWKELANDFEYKQAIPANTDTSIKITFTATGTALTNNAAVNKIKFNSTTMRRDTQLTFSKFELRRVK